MTSNKMQNNNHVPSYENYYFINVIGKYISNERLFLLSKELFG